MELSCFADGQKVGATNLARESIPWENTVHPGISAETAYTGRGLAGVGNRLTGGPGIEVNVHRHSRAGKHQEPYNSQGIGDAHKRCAQALAADGGLVVAKDLPDCAGGVEALSQQEGPIKEEERGSSIDDILESMNHINEILIILEVFGEIGLN